MLQLLSSKGFSDATERGGGGERERERESGREKERESERGAERERESTGKSEFAVTSFPKSLNIM